MNNKLTQLRIIANIEGWSFLILLFVAMPLKYFAGIPLAVKAMGILHGALFTAFVWMLIDASIKHRLGYVFTFFAFIASLVPFGTFFLNKNLSQRELNMK
jgi:integral membrane protein